MEGHICKPISISITQKQIKKPKKRPKQQANQNKEVLVLGARSFFLELHMGHGLLLAFSI